MYDSSSIENSIKKGIPLAQVKVNNPRGDNEHFIATVISEKFEGKTLIEQHQMVYDTLKKEFSEGLHSLSLKTKIKNE